MITTRSTAIGTSGASCFTRKRHRGSSAHALSLERHIRVFLVEQAGSGLG
jgi:hypothetical protein